MDFSLRLISLEVTQLGGQQRTTRVSKSGHRSFCPPEWPRVVHQLTDFCSFFIPLGVTQLEISTLERETK